MPTANEIAASQLSIILQEENNGVNAENPFCLKLDIDACFVYGRKDANSIPDDNPLNQEAIKFITEFKETVKHVEIEICSTAVLSPTPNALDTIWDNKRI